MSNRDKQTILKELNELINQIPFLTGQRRLASSHTAWLLETMSLLDDVFGKNSSYYASMAELPWQKIGTMVYGGFSDPDGPNIAEFIERQHQDAYRQQLDTARGILQAAIKEVEKIEDVTKLYHCKDTIPEASQFIKIINLVEYKLRKVIHDKPSNEKEIQDAFENLLIGADIPYSREAERIEYSSKTYQPDFTIDRIGLAIDIKFCGRQGREKEIISEMNDDVLAYRTKYPNVLFVVYDLGLIRDIERFASSFEENENIIVRVVKQ